MLRFMSTGLLGFVIRQVSKKSNRRDLRMSFKQLAVETFAEAWKRYHGFMTDLPTAGMQEWEFTQGFYCGLSQESKEHIDALAGGTFMLDAKEAQTLFEKLPASEMESEEHGFKENSHTVEIDPLTRKFQGMALTQPAASEPHQAEQEILAQPSDGKKMPMSRINNDAILDNFRNRLKGPALPTVPCILGPFKVHHALCDWGPSRNILPKMVYDCFDEDPLVPTPYQLRLVVSIMMQPFLKLVRATIDKTRGIINMKVDMIHEKFIYHPKNLACYCQIRVHRFVGSRRVRCVEVVLEHMKSRPQS
jgi:hypothetical protein